VLNKNQKNENSNGDKNKPEINDNHLLKKNTSETESPDKNQNGDKIQEIYISSKGGKDFNLPKIKIIDSKSKAKEDKVILIQMNSEKPNLIVNHQNQANAENENELIEKHKMLIKLYNIEKELDGEENNELETEVEKIKTEDINSCTRDFNFVVVFIIFNLKG